MASRRIGAAVAAALLVAPLAAAQDGEVRDIGSRLELLVDRWLVDSAQGATRRLAEPIDAGAVLEFDRPYEGAFCNFVTVLQDGPAYRMYYRGKALADKDGTPDEVTCYAESPDSIRWTKPDVGLIEVAGSRRNNVVLDKTHQPAPHNFAVFRDTRPGVPADERYKGLGGLFEMPDHATSHGVLAFVSGDGIRWRRLRAAPVIDRTVYPVRYTDTAPVSAFRQLCPGLRGALRAPLGTAAPGRAPVGRAVSRLWPAPGRLRAHSLLGLLSRTAYDSIRKSCQALFGRADVRPGCIISIQTFGSFGANFHPHPHALISEGVFSRAGESLELPSLDTAAVCELFRRLLLRRLNAAERLSERFMENLLGWVHPGCGDGPAGLRS